LQKSKNLKMDRNHPLMKENLCKMVRVCELFKSEQDYHALQNVVSLLQDDNTTEEDYCRACASYLQLTSQLLERHNITPTDADAFEQLLQKIQ